MKKKVIVAIMCLVCLLSVVLAGCSTINTTNIDEDVIQVFQEAIKKSESYETYYVREKQDTDPKNIAKNKRTEVMLNYQANDNAIDGVNNTKVNFSIKHTVGISEYTDSFIFGQSVSKNVKKPTADDYKFHVFENYKLKSTSPAFTKDCYLYSIEDMLAYQNPLGRNLSDYTMKNALNNLRTLTANDVVMVDAKAESAALGMDIKGSKKQGKVSTYSIKVTNTEHVYNKLGVIYVQIYSDKDYSRVMSISSADEKYTLDFMYQGPKIDIPNYDSFRQSDNIINVVSDRSDGLVGIYMKNKEIEPDSYNAEELIFATTINPTELYEEVVVKDGREYRYVITTVESAVNWSYEYTEIKIRLLAWENKGKKDEKMFENIEDNKYYTGDDDGSIFIKTSIITKKKELTSMIPMAAAVVAVIALLISLLALIKIKKQNKELTNKIKAITGESDEELIIDAEIITEESEAVKEIESASVAEPAVEGNANQDEIVADVANVEETADSAEQPAKAAKTTKSKTKKADAEKSE